MSRFKKSIKETKIKPVEIINENTDDQSTINNNNNNLSLKEVRSIQSIAENIVQNQVTQLMTELSNDELEIARMVAYGNTDDEIIKKYKNYSLKDLRMLKNKAIFLTEVTSIQYKETFSNQNVRLQALNKVQSLLFKKIVTEDVSEMSITDATKMFKLINDAINKETVKENETKKVDITLIMKELGMKENSLKEKDGLKYIESEYPVINGETGEIEYYQ